MSGLNSKEKITIFESLLKQIIKEKIKVDLFRIIYEIKRKRFLIDF